MRLSTLFILISALFFLPCGCTGNTPDAIENNRDAIEGPATPEPTANATPPAATGEVKTTGEKLTSASQILTVNGDPVYWPEFRFWLNYIGKYYKNTLGVEDITDWDVQQNGQTLEDFFLSTAVGYARKDRAIEARAKALDIGLSQEDIAEIEEKRASNIRIYGSVSEYRRIVASMYMSEEVFNYLTEIDHLGNYLFEHFYGKNGKDFTDSEVSAFVNENGFMCAKYIFRSNLDAEGNVLSTELQSENIRTLETLLARLDADGASTTLFTELMKTHGEDESILRYPNGSLLLPGSKGVAFETACMGLKENEHSGIVTTREGSYIILRMPIFPSMVVDSSGTTLRYRAAYERFKEQVELWSNEMNVDYEDAYYQVNVKAVL